MSDPAAGGGKLQSAASSVGAPPIYVTVQSPRPQVIQPVIQYPPPSKHEMPWWVDWLSAFAFLIPLGATITGWIIVAKQGDRRERRKDIRDQIETLRDRAHEVEQLVQAYIGLPAHNAQSSIIGARITGEIQSIENIVKVMITAGLPFNDFGLIVNLRMAATGGDFETVLRRVGDTARIAAVSIATSDLVDGLDQLYFKTFPIKCA